MRIHRSISVPIIMLVSAILLFSCGEDKESLPDGWVCINDELECNNDCPAELSATTEFDCTTGEITVSIKVKNNGDASLDNLQLHSQYKTEGRDEAFLPESDFSRPGPGIVDYFHTIELLEAGESAVATFIHRYESIERMLLEGAIVEDIHLCIPNQAKMVIDDEIYYCE